MAQPTRLDIKRTDLLKFIPINAENERYVSDIFAGEEAQYWVHYNEYWLENSRRLPAIRARLVYPLGRDQPVRFVVYGPHFADEKLTQNIPGVYEIIHMVIHETEQRRGYGRQATLQAIDELCSLPDCLSIVVAYNPDNLAAQHLYTSLHFVEYGRNYDDDPLLRLVPPSEESP